MDNNKRIIELAEKIEDVNKLDPEARNIKLQDMGIMSMAQARRTVAMAEQIRQLSEEKVDNTTTL